jgi:hypothetical protein
LFFLPAVTPLVGRKAHFASESNVPPPQDCFGSGNLLKQPFGCVEASHVFSEFLGFWVFSGRPQYLSRIEFATVETVVKL